MDIRKVERAIAAIRRINKEAEKDIERQEAEARQTDSESRKPKT